MTARPHSPTHATRTPAISVIVPVHDVAGHLDACLDSIAAQSLDDLECLVIDDGSTDGSGAIARTHAARDARFTVITQANRGLSAARNAGLDRACGACIAFVDGDDRVMPDYLARLYGTLRDTGADWVACAMASVHPDGRGFAHAARHDAPRLTTGLAPRRFALRDWSDAIAHFPSAWNKLYRRGLIDGLRFDEGTWFEDHAFFLQAAARTDHLEWLPQALYLQTRGRVGQITGADDDQALQQFPVLDRIAGILKAGPHGGAHDALARLACRLIHERSVVLHDTDRRARFLAAARDWLAARGIAFVPQSDAARALALELAGTPPLSVVIARRPGDRAALAATRAALRTPGMPGHEVIEARHAEAAAKRARGRAVVFLKAGDRPAPGGLEEALAALLRHEAAICLAGDATPALWPDGPPRDPVALSAPQAAALGPGRAGRIFDRHFLRDGGRPRAGTRTVALDWPALVAPSGPWHRGLRALRRLGRRLKHGTAPGPADATALARFSDSQAHAPAPDPLAVFDVLPLPSAAARRATLLALSEHFCRAGQDTDGFAARGSGLRFTRLRTPWERAAALPFLYRNHGPRAALKAMRTLAAAAPAEIPTAPVADLVRLVLRDARHRRTASAPWRAGTERALLRAVADYLRAEAAADGDRVACTELTAAWAEALRASPALPRALARPVTQVALAVFGASRQFWAAVGEAELSPDIPPGPARARAAFARLEPARADAIDALRALEAEGCGTARLRAELPGSALSSPTLSAPGPSAPAPRRIRPAGATRHAQAGALDLLSPPDRLEAARAAPVAVIAVMRNEATLLPAFLAHYRTLGIESFLVVDNRSDDGTREALLAAPDVALFSAGAPYSAARHGVTWQHALLQAFRVGRWSLVADADELLVWQHPGHPRRETLPDLLAGPDFAGAEAARVFMLDLYPDGPLSAVTLAGDPFAEAGFADRVPFLAETPVRGPFSNAPCWTSALRHRLLPGSPPGFYTAQKIALLRYHPAMRPAAGFHFLADARLARRELIFGHVKYNAAFHARAEAEAARAEHWNGAAEYRRYRALLAQGEAQFFHPDLSVPWHEAPFVAARLDGAPSGAVRDSAPSGATPAAERTPR